MLKMVVNFIPELVIGLMHMIKKKNIALEYDEPKHYIDIKNNILREKDIKR